MKNICIFSWKLLWSLHHETWHLLDYCIHLRRCFRHYINIIFSVFKITSLQKFKSFTHILSNILSGHPHFLKSETLHKPSFFSIIVSFQFKNTCIIIVRFECYKGEDQLFNWYTSIFIYLILYKLFRIIYLDYNLFLGLLRISL